MRITLHFLIAALRASYWVALVVVVVMVAVYKKKTEAAKKDYLKALAAYRASLVSKVLGAN
ncbi:AGAP000281-PA-like protein [Anopheles sinensis]|uniref:AGAP000281-PA-like protein n=1 Tax=Anopheles sinensis TaxID=74873 RepID=A0A084VNW9_ANOSI|nr:AGAP000281-PA-like protein [Anopheles sinensis]